MTIMIIPRTLFLVFLLTVASHADTFEFHVPSPKAFAASAKFLLTNGYKA